MHIVVFHIKVVYKKIAVKYTLYGYLALLNIINTLISREQVCCN